MTGYQDSHHIDPHENKEDVPQEELKVKKGLVRRSKKQLREDLKKASYDMPPSHLDTNEDLRRISKKQLRELKAAKQKKKKQDQHYLSCPPPVEEVIPTAPSKEEIERKGHGK